MAEPTKDEAFWRDEHAKQPYAKESVPYEHYAPAYRTGVQAAEKYAGKSFEEIEDDIALDYEQQRAGSPLPWDQVRPAVKAAWDRLGGVLGPRDSDRGIRTGM